MPSAHQAATPVYFDISEQVIDEALAAWDGDARAVIRDLLLGQAWLEHELSRAIARTSAGYVRGRPVAPERAS